MWSYEQTTGRLNHDGEPVGECGYSGFEDGKNNPAMQTEPDCGPIPRGRYMIGPVEFADVEGPHGPFVLPLTADPANEMFGRSGFLIHGDSLTHPGCASRGCIILPRPTREAIAQSSDPDLEVVE
ncbi:MAG: tlde1 domain-containing protein [Bryobacteraceae bacterium]|jgi:hypothetical protein